MGLFSDLWALRNRVTFQTSTKPGIWSDSGWGDLRFGMGPKDVHVKLQPSLGEPERRFEFHSWADSGTAALQELTVTGLQLARHSTDATLTFHNGRLYQIALIPEIASDAPRNESGIELDVVNDDRDFIQFNRAVRAMLAEKYGPPQAELACAPKPIRAASGWTDPSNEFSTTYRARWPATYEAKARCAAWKRSGMSIYLIAAGALIYEEDSLAQEAAGEESKRAAYGAAVMAELETRSRGTV